MKYFTHLFEPYTSSAVREFLSDMSEGVRQHSLLLWICVASIVALFYGRLDVRAKH